MLYQHQNQSAAGNPHPFRSGTPRFVSAWFRLALLALVVLVSLPYLPATAQVATPVELIKDIEDRLLPSQPNNLTVVGKRVFFSIDSVAGKELWVSDGTATGTRMVRDIVPGPAGSNPSNLTAVGTRVFFMTGPQFGSTGGPLKSDQQGSNVSESNLGLQHQDGKHKSLTFVSQQQLASNTSVSRELWVSDGTEGGTMRVYEILPEMKSWYFIGLTAVGDTLFFFTANVEEPETSRGTLWKVVGNNVIFVRDNLPSAYNQFSISGSFDTAAINNTYYFTFKNELWRSDGTFTGTRPFISDPSSGFSIIGIVQNTLFFTGAEGQVWKSDGTQEGTVPFPLPLNTYFYAVTAYPSQGPDTFLFTTINSIWQSNGTNAGTRQLVSMPNLGIDQIEVVAGTIYFGGRTRHNSWELWRTNGTPEGTILLSATVSKAGFSYINDMVDLNGRLVFLANKENLHGNYDLWTSDGTVEGTYVIKRVGVYTASLNNFHIIDNRLFFVTSSLFDRESALWISDGTTEGTQPIKLPQRGSGDAFQSFPFDESPIVSLKGNLYALASNIHGHGLWRSDGTPVGTAPVKIFPSANGEIGAAQTLVTNSLVGTAERLFFTEIITTTGFIGFWTSDGTEANTIPLTTTPDTPHLQVAQGILNNNLVAIVVHHGLQPGYALWTSNGTPAGTVNQGVINGLDEPATFGQDTLNGKLFFLAGHNQSTHTLWQTDGTLAGTTIISTLPGTGRGFSGPVVMNDALFFVVQQNDHYELWISDGSGGGTRRIVALPTGVLEFSIPTFDAIAAVGNTVYFAADDGIHGVELWASDGTAAGTRLVADINPGPTGSAPSGLANINGTLLFGADDGLHGSELWSSDGTAAGTSLLADIAPGVYSSRPSSFASGNGFVAFIADDGVTGRELHKISTGTAARLQLAEPPLVSAAPQAGIPLSMSNLGATQALSVTLSVTLGAGLTYVGDTSGISPTVSGNTLTWQLPALTPLVNRQVRLLVAAPDRPLGTRMPVDVRLAGRTSDGAPLEASFRTEVLVARQVFLPVVRR